MKKVCFVFGLLLMGSGVFAQIGTKAAPFDWDEWQHGFFLDTSVLGNYEDADPREGLRIETWFLLFEIGGGYDFGRITIRLYGDFGFPLTGVAYWGDGARDVKNSLDVSNGKFGMEATFKIVDTRSFDILLPLGLVFSKTLYTQMNPSYIESGVAVDRKWIYEYTSIVAGLDFTIRLSDHLKLCVMSGAAYPLVSNHIFEIELQDGYVFTATGDSKDRVKEHADILTFSAGIGLRINF
jgi:hypothetical protein